MFIQISINLPHSPICFAVLWIYCYGTLTVLYCFPEVVELTLSSSPKRKMVRKWSFVKKNQPNYQPANQCTKNQNQTKKPRAKQNNQTLSLDIHMFMTYLILLTFHLLFRLCLTFFNEVEQANVMCQVCAQVHFWPAVLENIHSPLRTQRTNNSKELSKI